MHGMPGSNVQQDSPKLRTCAGDEALCAQQRALLHGVLGHAAHCRGCQRGGGVRQRLERLCLGPLSGRCRALCAPRSQPQAVEVSLRTLRCLSVPVF